MFWLKNRGKKGGTHKLTLSLLRKEDDKPYSCAITSGHGREQYGTACLIESRVSGSKQCLCLISQSYLLSLHFSVHICKMGTMMYNIMLHISQWVRSTKQSPQRGSWQVNGSCESRILERRRNIKIFAIGWKLRRASSVFGSEFLVRILGWSFSPFIE